VKVSGFLKMIGMHVKAEIRINLLGAAIFNLFFTPLVILGVGKWIDGKVLEQIGTSIGRYMVISMTAGLSMLIIIQLTSEMMMERSSGVLLRARSLPNGPMAWAIGKSISTGIVVLLMQILILIGGFVFFDMSQLGAGTTLLVVLVMLFSVATHAPIGLILGSLVREMYGNVVITLGVLALFATSGIAFPLDILPRPVQAVQLVLPTFWSGHLVRSVVMPAQAGAAEVVGSFQPLLASGILALWLVAGFFVASFLIKRFFRHESIGAMQKMQNNLRRQLGA